MTGKKAPVADLKHGDHVDAYEIDGSRLYSDLIFTDAYLFYDRVTDGRVPLDFSLNEPHATIVQFWHSGKQDYVEFSVEQKSDQRAFYVTGHGWR